MNRLESALESVWSALFPLRCYGCGRRGQVVCERCREWVPWIGNQVCPRCARPSTMGRICGVCVNRPQAMDGMRAVCSHEGMIRKLVHDLKYRHARSLAAWGGEVLYRSLSSRPVTVDAIVPVPLAPRRQRERGYNQSELLGRELAARWGVPVETTVLRRVRETPPQVGKSAAERRANVRGAFACIEGAPVTDRRILLVDDVATTGATLNACAEPLKAAGATRVVGLVLAKGMLTPGDVRL